ncbi:hypothetical protein V1264_019932 [Littorina saxatilis]|uniref:Uncharacterized protein n=1 Tax=Littorina saxatilis TaxID=31220 RepID=A0AAN9GAC9_9CAEN
MALLQYTIVVCFTILNLVVIIDGLWYEEHGTHNGIQKWLCKKTEQLFVRFCLENPNRHLCLKLQWILKLGRCTPACRMSTAYEESEQMCRTDCDEGDVVPGLCGRHEKCCLADTGMDECPTSDEGVTCESADKCTGSGVTVDSGFACSTGEGQVCCRRVCPFDLADYNCEQPKCSDSYFQVQAPCPNAGDLCCELGLGKR